VISRRNDFRVATNLCVGLKYKYVIIIIIIIIIIFINCSWVVNRWQWLFYMYTNKKKESN